MLLCAYIYKFIGENLLLSLSLYFLIILSFTLITYLLMINTDTDQYNNLNKNSSFIDIFYFNISTLSSVGYGDIYPISQTAKLISIFGQMIILVLLLDGTEGIKKLFRLC